ncbi:uncharacterized protein LOC129961661 [Argiope bruennichi]|uniref:Zinc transporter ZIP1 like protein n=1 Tax=Argiope bruennichi TaxID=94029 RepID=A0A8T0FU98_ARGBR|nr:uncharacterized protein LOC129961661 [Argiope bruennichi]KAF8793835.1 Zinc transporter ZIP1 like protein [Argiope bruennichi]
MKNFYVQLFTLLILLMCNFLVGLIPFIALRVIGRLTGSSHAASQRNRVLSFFLHMGGGVFMSVCLLILMPESRQQFEEYERDHHKEHTQNTTDGTAHEEHHQEEFPIPEFVVLCGFFATFAVEEALHYILYHCKRKQSSTDHRVRRFCSCAKRHTECSRTFKAEKPEQTMFGREKRQSQNNSDLSGLSEQTASTANLLQSSILAQPVPNYGSVTNMADPRPNETVPVLAAPVVIANNGNVTFVRRLQDLSSPVTTSTSNVLLVIALSLYALIQGATIGLLTQSSPWTTLLVTCFQQSILVFIIGWVGVAQKEHYMPVVVYVAVMSLMSPFGISLSMFNEQNINDIPSIVSGVSKAIVCGSLLYLTFCDLLRRRSLKESPHIERFAGFTLGAAIMAALEYISIIV